MIDGRIDQPVSTVMTSIIRNPGLSSFNMFVSSRLSLRSAPRLKPDTTDRHARCSRPRIRSINQMPGNGAMIPPTP